MPLFLLAFAVVGYFVYRYYQNDKEQEDRFASWRKLRRSGIKSPFLQSFHRDKKSRLDWLA